MSEKELIIGFFEKGYCCDLDEVKNVCLDLLKENEKLNKQLEEANKKLYLCTPEIPQNSHGTYISYVDLVNEMYKLKKQLEYLRSGEYYNQLKFERDMLQQVVDTNGVPSEVYDYIECVHRNTELLEENEKLKAELGLYRGSLHREHEAIHKANDLEDELKEYKQKYLNAVADYENAMSEKVELEKQLRDKIGC